MKSNHRYLHKVILLILVIFLPLSIQKTIPNVKAQTYTNISVNEAYDMIANTSAYPNLMVLDVRTDAEFDTYHICNANLIPLEDLTTRINELELYNDTEIIVYCQSGGRSATASQILVDAGFNKIYNMIGGISSWINAGYEICPIGSYGPRPIISFSITTFVILFCVVNCFLILLIKRKVKKKI
ncbi:MAG: rhodanese-like domain-containing protein [Promethearchaeota archaeon]